jgi:hypothetical protein
LKRVISLSARAVISTLNLKAGLKIIEASVIAAVAVTLASSTVASAAVTAPSRITANTTWTAAAGPYMVKSAVTVSANVTLTIEPGTVVKFLDTSSRLLVAGSLTAIGTPDRRIVFTSIKDDSVGGDTGGDGPSTPAAGDWYYIGLSGSSSILRYTDIRYGGYGVRAQSNAAVQILSLANHEVSYSTITNSLTSAIYLYQGNASLYKNTLNSNVIGISFHNSTVTVSDNDISYNKRMGVYTMSTSLQIVPRSTFTGNTISFNGEVAVSIYANPTDVPTDKMPVGNLNYIFGNNYKSSNPLPLQIVSAFFVPTLDWTNNFWANYSRIGSIGEGTAIIDCPVYISGLNNPRMLVYQSTAQADCPKTPIGSRTYFYMQYAKLGCCHDHFIKVF